MIDGKKMDIQALKVDESATFYFVVIEQNEQEY